MSNETIAVTGATGFIGFSILLRLLKSGYNVRIVVRSEAKAEGLRSHPVLKALQKESSISYYIVPDLSIIGALDEATKGADYVIHTASPLPFGLCEPENQYDEIVLPAINCTLSALESAKRSGTVKRVVVTSSCGAYITPEILLGPELPEPVTLSEKDRNPEYDPHTLMSSPQQKPAFDMVCLAPTYVMGRSELAQSVKELFSTSNGLFLRMAAGVTEPNSPPEVAAVVHIDDVVDLHFMALNKEKIPGGQTFLFSRNVAWNDVTPIIQEMYPEAVKSGLLPNTGNVPSKKVFFDSSKTEQTFGIKLRSVEEMVESLIPQYIELLEKEKKAVA
ncbi:hypothetical protein H2203_005343 [Taxawa tesnikishii (nom. ined.)]|nr:hypothetical protein H2203_005343 [Dothideales sp. JES 119]